MRKRILTALLAAAMMLSVGAGCYYEEQVPDDSSEPETTTSVQSKASTPSKASTTTTSAATTTSKPSTPSRPSSPTAAKFPYKLIKRPIVVTTSGGGSSSVIPPSTSMDIPGPSDPSSGGNPYEFFYDEYRDYKSVGDAIISATSRNMNRNNPTEGGFWRANGTNLADNLKDFGDTFNGTTLWPYGAYMEGVGARVSFESPNIYQSKGEYEKLLKNVTRFTDNRYNSSTSIGLACVQGGGPAQIFNDDNVWIALEWINAYKLLKSPEYLTLAKRNLNFIWESWDTEKAMNGGIWWMRPGTEGGEKPQKNACINAPYAWAAAEMYEVLKEGGQADESYLNHAKDAFNWVKDNLWDKNKDLIQDKWFFSDKGNYQLDGSLYAYNTGCMIGAGAKIYQMSGEADYHEAARKLADGSMKNFFSERMKIRASGEDAPEGAQGYYFASISPQGDANRCWFRSNLVKGIFELYNVEKAVDKQAEPKYARVALNAVAVGAVNAGRIDGFINPDFRNGDAPTLNNITPTSQGSAARMMYMCAEFLKNNRDFDRIPD